MLKAHKYWSIGALVCMIMAIYTGHQMVSGKGNKKGGAAKAAEESGEDK